MTEYPITSQRGQEMLTYLPQYYVTSRVVRSLLQDEGTEFDQIKQAMDETLNQFFVNTATWSLDTWETEMGLPLGQTMTDQERRERIISRLRGYGTATISVIKNVAESYDKGKINVVEDVGTYTVRIQFVDTTGVPPNEADLKAALRAVIPAHLDIVYEYNYFLWQEWDAKSETWDTFDGLALSWDALEVRN